MQKDIVQIKHNGLVVVTDSKGNPVTLGDITKSTWDNLWNSNKDKIREENGITNLPLLMSFDMIRACNLRCPTCRSDLRTTDLEGTEKAVDETIKMCSFLKTLQFYTGDVFSSKNGRRLLRSIPNNSALKKLTLGTNLIAFNFPLWKSVSNIHDRNFVFSVSIDAATPETYEKNRPPATWDMLVKRLKIIEDIKKDHKINLHFNFVVQENNYKEMPLFIEFAKHHRARVIWHLPLYWPKSGYTEEEYYRTVEIHNPKHRNHQNLLRVLEENSIKVEDLYGCGSWYIKTGGVD